MLTIATAVCVQWNVLIYLFLDAMQATVAIQRQMMTREL
jgi:hypothetical protein